MIKKIKTLLVTAALALAPAAPLAVTGTVFAQNGIQTALCNGAETATQADGTLANGGCENEGNADITTQLAEIASTIINVLSILVGIIAVIFIIVGGFKYITSGGESSNVSGAKNTIIYAIIGLILVALAQVIVRVVLEQATEVTA